MTVHCTITAPSLLHAQSQGSRPNDIKLRRLDAPDCNRDGMLPQLRVRVDWNESVSRHALLVVRGCEAYWAWSAPRPRTAVTLQWLQAKHIPCRLRIIVSSLVSNFFHAL